MNLFALAEEKTTIWEDLWEYIRDVYFAVDGNYQHLGLDTGTVTSVRIIVLGLFIGVIIACVAMAYNKQVLGGFARKLLSLGVNSADKAMTLEQLGYLKNPFIRSAVQRSVSLRRVVRCVEEEKFNKEQEADREAYEKKREAEPKLPKFREQDYRVDPKLDSFYIPEELSYTAERKFTSKGSSWVVTLIGIIVLFIAFFVLLLVLPHVLSSVDDFIGGFKQ